MMIPAFPRVGMIPGFISFCIWKVAHRIQYTLISVDRRETSQFYQDSEIRWRRANTSTQEVQRQALAAFHCYQRPQHYPLVILSLWRSQHASLEPTIRMTQ